jgi:hypothetical protein
MWSKRPKSGGKGLRCKIHVHRPSGLQKISLVPCDRPAKRYGQQVKAFWLDGELLDVGIIDCCLNHAAKLRKQGVILKCIDRRKKAAPVSAQEQ